jgi:hypothetical protein
MSSTKQNLRLAGAFAALAALALAVSCTGFFPPEQIGTLTISPTSPTVPLGGTTQLTAFGTNTDGSSAGNVTGKVTWSSNSGTVSVSPSGGLLTGNDISTTPATITATFQAVTATASATVCVEGGTNPKIVFSQNPITEGALEDITATMTVGGVAGTDVSSGVQWATNNTSLTITSGDPATMDTSTLGTITTAVSVVVSGTYTCNGVNTSFQSTLTIDP